MEHFKRSTSRDFRINCATLDAALREESSEEEVLNLHAFFAHAISTFTLVIIYYSGYDKRK